MNPIITQDGDTLVVIAKTPLTVSDPVDEFPYVSQAYRVVADRVGNTLVLVPLSASASRVSVWEVDRAKERIENQKALPAFVETSGANL